MRAVRPSNLVVPGLWTGLVAFVAALAVGRDAGAGAGVAVGVGVWVLLLAVAARAPIARWRAARAPFPDPWRRWLREHVPVYAQAPDADRARFERDVRLTIAGLRFEGAGGAEPTESLRLAVGAGAALLLHGHPDWDLPMERTILFVPDTFDEAYGDEEAGIYDGMVHPQGPVVLSVRATLDGWARDDGQNVVLHELAHLFDMDGLGADGVPVFLDPRSAEAWTQLLRDEMRRARMGRSVLRSYAASAPAELFAVATEQFFERPARLRNRHPELHAALVAFYNVDPPDEAQHDAEESFMARRWDAPPEAGG